MATIVVCDVCKERIGMKTMLGTCITLEDGIYLVELQRTGGTASKEVDLCEKHYAELLMKLAEAASMGYICG